MAYTPINWQTGDTITAEKLNRCDNGWSVSSTQLFSETVTTEDDGGVNYGELTYTSFIDADSIVVTFDGTEYTCSKSSPIPVASSYGAPETDNGYDFSTYPFSIGSTNLPMGVSNEIFTSTAGEHTVSVGIPSVEVSGKFAAAVGTAVDVSSLPMLCVNGVTTWDEMDAARTDGRLLYLYADSGMHIITSFGNYESAIAVNALPAGVVGSETYGFDSNMVFEISYA